MLFKKFLTFFKETLVLHRVLNYLKYNNTYTDVLANNLTSYINSQEKRKLYRIHKWSNNCLRAKLL